MKKGTGENSDYVKEINEWQDYQYDPGHYPGGNIPGNLLHSSVNPKLKGAFLIIIGAMIFVPGILCAVGTFLENGLKGCFR